MSTITQSAAKVILETLSLNPNASIKALIDTGDAEALEKEIKSYNEDAMFRRAPVVDRQFYVDSLPDRRDWHTPLSYAATINKPEMVAFLLMNGAKPTPAAVRAAALTFIREVHAGSMAKPGGIEMASRNIELLAAMGASFDAPIRPPGTATIREALERNATFEQLEAMSLPAAQVKPDTTASFSERLLANREEYAKRASQYTPPTPWPRDM